MKTVQEQAIEMFDKCGIERNVDIARKLSHVLNKKVRNVEIGEIRLGRRRISHDTLLEYAAALDVHIETTITKNERFL